MLETAAAKNNSGAMFALGALNNGGYGLPMDLAIAQKWFRAAAALGHGQAQLMVGRYLASIGRVGDREEARDWLQQAASQGVPDAQAELARLGLLDHPRPPTSAGLQP
jgi:TPR repeat protein